MDTEPNLESGRVEKWQRERVLQTARVSPFFITGLPRSRTAWLANLFTTDTSLCYHEPVGAADNLTGSVAALARLTVAGLRIGISDAALTGSFEKVSWEFPESRWLYVQREEAAAMASLMAFIQPHVQTSPIALKDYLQKHQAAAARMKLDERVLFVNFQELDRQDVIVQAWQWLMPEKPFSTLRWLLLCGLNVQQDVRSFRERMQDKDKGRESQRFGEAKDDTETLKD